MRIQLEWSLLLGDLGSFPYCSHRVLRNRPPLPPHPVSTPLRGRPARPTSLPSSRDFLPVVSSAPADLRYPPEPLTPTSNLFCRVFTNSQVEEIYLSPFACITTCYTRAGSVLAGVSHGKPRMLFSGFSDRLRCALQSGTHLLCEDLDAFSCDAYTRMATGIPRVVAESPNTRFDRGGGRDTHEDDKWRLRDRDRPGQSKASDCSTTTGWSSNSTFGGSALPEHSAKDIDVVRTYRNPVSKTRWGT